jgi:exonuclease SbcD
MVPRRGGVTLRVLHTADWHLGRTLEGRGRLDEQAAVLEEICELAEAEAADLVLIAGDVYDSVNPPAAAEELFYGTLERLSAAGRRAVVAIAGNHDSPDRLCAARSLAGRHGIALVGLPGETIPAAHGIRSGPGWLEVAVPGCGGAVVAALPYPSEMRLGRALRDTLDEPALQAAYSEQVGRLLARAAERFRPGTVHLVVGHVYAAGGIESDSERPIQVGGAYTVQASAFPADAQYVALGHLHRPQVIAGPVPIRYSGTPLAYSFSEAGQAKGVVLVEVLPGRPAQARELPLSRGRPLVVWRAAEGIPQVRRWAEAGRDPGAWIDLELHVDAPLSAADIQGLRQLRAEFVHIRPVLPEQPGPAPAEARAGLPLDELFRLFYRRTTGGDVAPAVARLFAELIAEGPEDEEGASA